MLKVFDFSGMKLQLFLNGEGISAKLDGVKLIKEKVAKMRRSSIG